MKDFFDKDSSIAYEQIKEALYSRLNTIENNIAEYNDDPQINLDSEAIREYLDCMGDARNFLRDLIDKMERS